AWGGWVGRALSSGYGEIGAAGGAGCFFFSSRRRHTRLVSNWSSDVCSSDLLDRRLEPDPDGLVEDGPVVIGRRGPVVGPVRDREIGRASCRERGQMSVGAVALKKKAR